MSISPIPSDPTSGGDKEGKRNTRKLFLSYCVLGDYRPCVSQCNLQQPLTGRCFSSTSQAENQRTVPKAGQGSCCGDHTRLAGMLRAVPEGCPSPLRGPLQLPEGCKMPVCAVRPLARRLQGRGSSRHPFCSSPSLTCRA